MGIHLGCKINNVQETNEAIIIFYYCIYVYQTQIK